MPTNPRCFVATKLTWLISRRWPTSSATLRIQLDYLDRAWKRVFEICPAGPSDNHPEHVEHVVQSLSELAEIRMLAALIGPAKFHGGGSPSEEQRAAERRFRHLSESMSWIPHEQEHQASTRVFLPTRRVRLRGHRCHRQPRWGSRMGAVAVEQLLDAGVQVGGYRLRRNLVFPAPYAEPGRGHPRAADGIVRLQNGARGTRSSRGCERPSYFKSKATRSCPPRRVCSVWVPILKSCLPAKRSFEYWRQRLWEGSAECSMLPCRSSDRVSRDQLDAETGYKRSSRDTFIQRLRSRLALHHDGW